MNILETVKLWAENPYFDTETRKEAKILLAEDKQTEREECFGSLLEFGTGGLRGIMGCRYKQNKPLHHTNCNRRGREDH